MRTELRNSMNEQKKKQLVVLSSPSGGGKSTVARHFLKSFPQMSFSVSATTRLPRPGEIDGMHYFFLSKDEFEQKIKNNELAEYEEIFGNYYGTLKSEINKCLTAGRVLLFDVDVKGAVSLRNAYPEDCLLIFISPPSLEILEQRLRNRKTESEEQLSRRLARAKLEMEYAHEFEYVIINDKLDQMLIEAEMIVRGNIF